MSSVLGRRKNESFKKKIFGREHSSLLPYGPPSPRENLAYIDLNERTILLSEQRDVVVIALALFSDYSLPEIWLGMTR